MSLIVQKFGGSSLADAEKIHRAAQRAIAAKNQGHQVIVVVSAMGKTTDGLVELAQRITPSPNRREMDQLLATGEQVSIALMAMAIHHQGYDAISLTGGQVGLCTDCMHGRARIREITERDKMLSLLRKGNVLIVAGFQGIDESANVTTLGRGGSDTTAVALAAALKADICEIYTDVDGVYSADPRIVPEARKLGYIFYDEMLELASLGAKVMHSRSIELGMNYGVRLQVRSSFTDAIGTDIVAESGDLEAVVVRGAALKKKLARLEFVGIPSQPGVTGRLFARVAERGIVVDDIVQIIREEGKVIDLSFTIDMGDLAAAQSLAPEIAAQLPCRQPEIRPNRAKVSIVGVGMRTQTGVALRMFQALHEAQVNIENITTSEIVVSCVIKEEDGEKALRAVHQAFDLEQGPKPRP